MLALLLLGTVTTLPTLRMDQSSVSFFTTELVKVQKAVEAVESEVMITASSHSDNAGESLSALRFGARASLVENSARENIAENAPRQTHCLRLPGSHA